MSVLARPQGYPERVWALVAGLAALGGRTDRDGFKALLNPGFARNGGLVQANPDLANDALGAASSLGLVDLDRNEAALPVSVEPASVESVSALADHLHDRLANLPAGDTNAVILDTYAWIVAESDRRGDSGWIYDLDSKALADQASVALAEDEDGRPMNSTKLPAWRRWLLFMGLCIPFPSATSPELLLSPTPRIAREIRRAGLQVGVEILGADFLAALAARMPYLDGGALFMEACRRIGHVPRPRGVSPLLSAALRDLHDEGVIALRARGDAADGLRLVDEPSHPIPNTFNLITVTPQEVRP